jgi:hypothetical protein
MANTLSVIDQVTREALRIAHEKLTFIGTINRSYDSSFAKSGAKIGDTLRIREPNQYTRRKGSRVMDVQDQAESTVSLTVATQDGVDMKFNSTELALSIDQLSERYIEPAMAVLCSGIEGDVLSAVTKNIANWAGTTTEVVGATDLDAVAQGRALLNQNLAPKDNNRCFQLDSVTMAAVSNGVSTGSSALFNPQADISKVFREGYLGRNNGVSWYENDRTYLHTSGADHTDVTVNETAFADGDTTMTVAGGSFAIGDQFSIAGVKAVHPETKAAFAADKKFVVTAVGTTTLTFLPAFQLTGAKQNISEFPSNSDVITVYAGNSVAYQSNLMYHKDAFAFVSADLPIMDDAIRCVRRVKDGLSVRCWQGSDIRNDELLLRLDILYGYKTLRPDWAVRINN